MAAVAAVAAAAAAEKNDGGVRALRAGLPVRRGAVPDGEDEALPVCGDITFIAFGSAAKPASPSRLCDAGNLICIPDMLNDSGNRLVSERHVAAAREQVVTAADNLHRVDVRVLTN